MIYGLVIYDAFIFKNIFGQSDICIKSHGAHQEFTAVSSTTNMKFPAYPSIKRWRISLMEKEEGFSESFCPLSGYTA